MQVQDPRSNRNPSLLWRFVRHMLVGLALAVGVIFGFLLELLPINHPIAVLLVTVVALIAGFLTSIDVPRLIAATYHRHC